MSGERPLVRTLLAEGEATLSAQHVPALHVHCKFLKPHAAGIDLEERGVSQREGRQVELGRQHREKPASVD